MDIKKKAFLEAYKKSFGNISMACKNIGIDRGTYYLWKKIPEFLEALEAIQPDEEFIDFAENALYKKINDGDTTAIIFALKTKGKKRGYVERTEMRLEAEKPIFNGINLDTDNV